MAANSDSNAVSKPSVQLSNTEEVQKVFNSFDANGDGMISAPELAGVLKALGSTYASADVTAIMNDIDLDRDGFVSLQEFAAFCRASDDAGGDASELREAFNLYDQDKNGLISASELHMVLNRIGMSCSVEDCTAMIKSVDSDGDGNVNFAEFEKMMTNKASEIH